MWCQCDQVHQINYAQKKHASLNEINQRKYKKKEVKSMDAKKNE